MNIGLIGATNVGKSTLFNRLIGQFRAIVTDIPGTTVDIIHHQVHTDNDELMTFFDSPGLLDFSDELPYIEQIVKDSDLLLFLVDDTVGITAKEQHILELIRKEKKQRATILVVNKLDVKWKERETELALADYYDLGIATVIGISAKNERNLTAIQDQIEKLYKQRKKEHPVDDSSFSGKMSRNEKGVTGLAIVGKPNAGKSTLLNTLVGKPLAKVADVAGTTRDYLVGEFDYKGKHYLAYDTAGIKKKGSIHGIEKIAYDKTKAMLEFIRPIVIFMVDCTQGITHRDMTLLQEIHSLALPIIFALNKIDQVNPKGLDAMLKNAQSYLEFAKYIPIVPMIATQGTGIDDVMKMVGLLQKENQKRVGTRELNQALQHEMIQRPPRFPKNKIAKILYATQIAVDAPTFVMFVNHKSRVNFAFKKWVENTIRRHFGFIGVPIVIKYRNRGEEKGGDFGRLDQKIAEDFEREDFGGLDQKISEDETKKISEDEARRFQKMKSEDDEGLKMDKQNKQGRINPYNNKGKRKWEKQTELSRPIGASSSSSTPSPRDDIKSGKDNTKLRRDNIKSRTDNNKSRRDVSVKRPSTKRMPPKREGKYSNLKQGSQKKLDEMFSKVYGEKKVKKGKKTKVNIL